jgi:DNA-binding NarL/FixJ family response regulator
MRSILLVEDHAIFASVLIRLLREVGDLDVTRVAKTAEEALQYLPDRKFDLVLVDVYLPKMNGINLVALIHDRYPDLPCLMLSGHMLDHYVKGALQAGARGYVLKDNPVGILAAIRKVLTGETYVSKELRNDQRNISSAEGRNGQ